MGAHWRRGRHAVGCWLRQRRGGIAGGCWCSRLNPGLLLSLDEARAAHPEGLEPMRRGRDFGRRRGSR
jgi:hypothetical protein